MKQPVVNTSSTDELLRTAIEQRRLVRLVYHDKERIIEPHDYGVQNGSVKLLAYQIAGASSGRLPSWKWLHADQISDIRLLDKTFPGGRPIASSKHSKWDELFIRVKPADTDAIEATALPLDEDANTTWDAAKLAGVIADLGYLQFGHLRGGWKENPALVLLRALSTDDLEVRITEALPWLVVHYPDLDWDWLIPRIKQRSLQNRLGFVVTLGRRVAEKERNERAATRLRQVEETLMRDRLSGEDTLCQSLMSGAERRWLRNSRPEDARKWNLLTDLQLDHLFYGS